MIAKLFKGILGQDPNADRKTMEAALKEHCIPVLRNQKFKGSFPNFYRNTDGFIALINFQFFSSGGSFCVNLGYADPQRENVVFRPDTEINKLTVNQTSANERYRLGAIEGGDHWFCFGKTSHEQFRGKSFPVKDIALTCGQLFLSEAESFWQSKRKNS